MSRTSAGSKFPDYVRFTKNPKKDLNRILKMLKPDLVAVLVDENTRVHCLKHLPGDLRIIEIKSGEPSKNLQTCGKIWTELTVAQFTRKSLLVNLGGGVIGDMGGFVAGTYKRGIRFVNIPTTLLSQVDASIGGKLGVDFNGLKNHIGIFKDPDNVLIWEGFLETLPEREIRSGFAEILKHGLIWDKKFWDKAKKLDIDGKVNWQGVVKQSVMIKNEVVAADPFEGSIRKILNFGHTIGHAIESWYLDRSETLLHGEAIAAGMIIESHLSQLRAGLSKNQKDQMVNVLIRRYGKLEKLPDINVLQSLIRQDKKNQSGEVRYSLLREIGTCDFDKQVSDADVNQSLSFYRDL